MLNMLVPFFLSLASLTVSLNVAAYPPTGRPTREGFHVASHLSTTAVDSVHGTTGTASEATDASVGKRNVSTKIDGDSGGRRKWEQVDAFLKMQTRGVLNLKDVIRRTDASDVCKAGLERYFNSLSDMETWSLKMAGANGKLDVGDVLQGRFASYGFYDECLEIRAGSSVEEEEFRGQYCMVAYTAAAPLLSRAHSKNGSLDRRYTETYGEPPQWIQDFFLRTGPYLQKLEFYVGTCVPSTCSDQDLTQIMTHIVAPFEVSVDVMECRVEQPVIWTRSLVAAVSVLGGIALLCILGTAVDILHKPSANRMPEEQKCNPSKLPTLLKMFSVPANVVLLLNKDNGGTFKCLDGIRFFSSAWIVLHHTYCLAEPLDFRKFSNGLAYEEDFSGSLPFAAIDNALMAVVTFFFLSGFLMAYMMWKKLEKSGQVNFFNFFLHKYWRMTPCIVLTLALFVVNVHTGSGPLWNTITEGPMEACNRNWWTNFLYIANWWEIDDMCLMHTWFVSCLMQFYVIGFIIIQITFRWPTVGVFLGSVVVLGCGVLVVTIAVVKNFPLPTSLALNEFDIWGVSGWCSWLRFKPYYYIQSFAIGMVVGYLVLKYKDQKIKRNYQALGWILSVGGSFYAVFGIHGTGSSTEYTAFYYGTGFLAWSLSLGWFVYACIAGYGGVLNSFLSWKGFHFLSNITYLTYLLHFMVAYYNNASLKEVIHYGQYEMLCSFLSTMAISSLLAFVGHVTVEMPFGHLEKVLL